AYEATFSESLPSANPAISKTIANSSRATGKKISVLCSRRLFSARVTASSMPLQCRRKSVRGQLCGEIEQFLQALIKTVELVLAQLVGGLEPKLVADKRERVERMPLRTAVARDLIQHPPPHRAPRTDREIRIE